MKNSIKILLFCIIICVVDILIIYISKLFVVRTIFLIHMYICIHEITHMVAYMIQGIKINSITLFGLKICDNEKVKLKCDRFKGYLGIVIPRIDDFSSNCKLKNRIATAIIVAPCCNLLIGVCSLLICIKYPNFITIISMLINMVMFFMAIGNNNFVSGDIAAYMHINRQEKFYYIYVYTFFKNYNDVNACERKKIIEIFEKLIIWGKKDIYTKKILLNILEEQLQLDDLAINNLFLENFIENKGYFVDGALKKKYIDYVICLKLVLVLVRYQLFEEAYQLFSNVEKVFPNNSLQLECKIKLNKHLAK
ncbi:MAG: hypothetical protein IJD58_06610 [Lachnospiraceae bacterium]|nr:hypothetical protein [Lachnospiraceae bacterium]